MGLRPWSAARFRLRKAYGATGSAFARPTARRVQEAALQGWRPICVNLCSSAVGCNLPFSRPFVCIRGPFLRFLALFAAIIFSLREI